MNKIDLNLEFCHGISKLDHCFDFSKGKDFLLYAQNGSMKTSFYNTIYEYKSGKPTQDVFFPQRATIREIKDENGNDIPSENIVCIGNDDYDLPTDNISSLLVNEKLKNKYDSIMSSLDKKIKAINKSIKSLSGDTVDTLFNDLGITNISEIPKCMFNKDNVIENFKNLKYKNFFNKDFEENLQEKDVLNSINDYIDLCNKIVEENPIFVKDVFELYNLKSINKSLNSNNYFTPGHLLKLYDKSQKVYKDFNQENLSILIESVDQEIAENDNINKVNQVLTSKIKTQELNVFLSQNQWIIPFLKDLDGLKKEYWHYILSSSQDLAKLTEEYNQLVNDNKKELDEILKESTSKENYSNWSDAIDIFNRKFINMPFELEIDNLSDVILKKSACSLKYKFHDISGVKNDDVPIDTLKNNLSKGERKAFNILNLIFEIQYRIKNNIETYVIIDDIADSFDYKNKYAIVELLKELNDNNLFHLIVMTHNFDFYRICANQLSVTTLSILKDTKINFISFYYKKNIFSTFKDNIDKEIYFLSAIPFVRNIIELTKGNNDSDYIFLTSTLHYKQNTSSILISQINRIFSTAIFKNSSISDNNYLNTLFATADSITRSTKTISLENKLCLSMAIRMKFEMFLFSKISSWNVINGFTKNQTYEMIRYCISKKLLTSAETIIASKVSIMTSENIHVNAFMYEPIIDMSDDELITLYKEVKLLK